MRRIHRLHAQTPPVLEDVSDEVALRTLLKPGDGDFLDSSPVCLAGYDSGTLSLPHDQVAPCNPSLWVRGECSKCLADPLSRMLWSERGRGALLDGIEMPGLYMHSTLSGDAVVYAKFLNSF